MKAKLSDKGKSGIYCIINKTNGKIYIGKAKCIYKRIKQHVTNLNRKIREQENDHFIHAWHKYGKTNFEYKVLEYLKLDEKLISSKELEYFKIHNSLNPKVGYNKRCDSDTGLIVSKETREKMRKSQLKRFKDPKNREACSHTYWKDNPDKLKEMSSQLHKAITKYDIYQYDKQTNKLIKVWNYITDIIKENPNYKKHNIYAVCSGEKPSMYGYIWKKVLKDDIVRSL